MKNGDRQPLGQGLFDSLTDMSTQHQNLSKVPAYGLEGLHKNISRYMAVAARILRLANPKIVEYAIPLNSDINGKPAGK